jgi:hypothetical protein
MRRPSTRNVLSAKQGQGQATDTIAHFPNGSALLQSLDVYVANPIDAEILFGPDGKMVRVQQVTIP